MSVIWILVLILLFPIYVAAVRIYWFDLWCCYCAFSVSIGNVHLHSCCDWQVHLLVYGDRHFFVFCYLHRIYCGWSDQWLLLMFCIQSLMFLYFYLCFPFSFLRKNWGCFGGSLFRKEKKVKKEKVGFFCPYGFKDLFFL